MAGRELKVPKAFCLVPDWSKEKLTFALLKNLSNISKITCRMKILMRPTKMFSRSKTDLAKRKNCAKGEEDTECGDFRALKITRETRRCQP